jgi:microcin C transport system substrate-binding protein
MRRFISTALSVLFLAAAPCAAAEPQAPPAAEAQEKVALPANVVWETNDTDPVIGSPEAKRGGNLNVALSAYPLTLRAMGPNSNDMFANWNQQFLMAFGLVQRHPVTDNFIPMMATHWSVQDDQKTIYFKLDPDAKFSNGDKVTADDYVFTWKMMQSKFIVDPYWNSFAKQYYTSVDKIDDYTLRIVGTRPSWRPLSDYAGLWPTPSHATVLDDTWVERTTNQPLIVPGPYVISDTQRGESITFKRVPNWWGDKKRYFLHQFNFDEIHIRIIPTERELDYLRRGEIDLMQEGTARIWNEGYNFPEAQKGWIRRARVFVDVPSGLSGILLNLEAPIFQNRDFRLAMQYLFNFERLNRNIMYSEYFRQVSFFQGTEYANPNIKSYPFDPAKAREYLTRAGYHRPAGATDQGLWVKLGNALRGLIFTRSDSDDILVNDRGEKASFVLLYDSKGLERHLTVMQQDFRRAGVEVQLQLLEAGTQFERQLERKYEATQAAMTSSFYPGPRQYLHSEFKPKRNNNNFWGFADPEVDELIRIYEEDLDADKRRAAMWRIDQIVHDQAIYIPFWDAPYQRLVWWDYIQFPEFYLPKRTQAYMYWMVYWFDAEKKAAVDAAKRDGTAFPVDPELDKDYYGVKKKFQ